MSDQKFAQKAVMTRPTDREIRVERVFDAPRERVFAAYTDPGLIEARWGEVAAPERIVQTFEWDGMPGHVSVDTATFEDLGDRTKVVSTSIFHTPENGTGCSPPAWSAA